MTSAPAPSQPRPGRARIGILAAAALALLLAWLLVPIDALARGWLVAFAVWSSFPIGSLVLLMIHRLTGGRWGEAAAPVLRPAAASLPLVALAFLPVAFALAEIYPWGAAPSAAPPGTGTYLGAPWFFVRAAVALVGWAALGIVFGLGRGGLLLAGLGLAFFGLTISLVAVDWYLSVEPQYVSTSFAAMIAIQQLLTALAVTAIVAPAGLRDGAVGDVAGLIIASILGVFYLELMTFIVFWYGDLPHKAAWFVKRGHAGWAPVIGTTVVLAAVAFACLLSGGIRRSRTGLRIVSLLALAGAALHFVWIIVPAFPAQAGVLLAACLFALGFGLATLALGPSFASLTDRGPVHAR